MAVLASIDREAVAELCRKHHVERLVLFGSAVRDDFDPSHSDYDFMVKFRRSAPNHFQSYFGLEEDLKELLGRPVDLVSFRKLRNPYFAASVEADAQVLYEA